MEMLIKAQQNVSIWAPGCVYTAAASFLHSKNHQLSNFCRITNTVCPSMPPHGLLAQTVPDPYAATE